MLSRLARALVDPARLKLISVALNVGDVERSLAITGVEPRIQIGMIRPIRVDHTNFFKWLLKLINSCDS